MGRESPIPTSLPAASRPQTPVGCQRAAVRPLRRRSAAASARLGPRAARRPRRRPRPSRSGTRTPRCQPRSTTSVLPCASPTLATGQPRRKAALTPAQAQPSQAPAAVAAAPRPPRPPAMAPAALPGDPPTPLPGQPATLNAVGELRGSSGSGTWLCRPSWQDRPQDTPASPRARGGRRGVRCPAPRRAGHRRATRGVSRWAKGGLRRQRRQARVDTIPARTPPRAAKASAAAARSRIPALPGPPPALPASAPALRQAPPRRSPPAPAAARLGSTARQCPRQRQHRRRRPATPGFPSPPQQSNCPLRPRGFRRQASALLTTSAAELGRETLVKRSTILPTWSGGRLRVPALAPAAPRQPDEEAAQARASLPTGPALTLELGLELELELELGPAASRARHSLPQSRSAPPRPSGSELAMGMRLGGDGLATACAQSRASWSFIGRRGQRGARHGRR
mmetsp:Transcript_13021/g.49783  ORF Transcript_13021/g.49783 Transcript_13021/m.49783 type:complete len:454 (+) Transcript_13021:171-1532(+)